MKEPIGLLGKSDLTIHNICEVEINTVETVSTREATKRLGKLLDSNYSKKDLK